MPPSRPARQDRSSTSFSGTPTTKGPDSPRRKDAKADHPVVPQAARAMVAPGLGGHIGKLVDSGIGETVTADAVLGAGGTTLGEHAPTLRRSAEVGELGGQRPDRLAGTEQPAVRRPPGTPVLPLGLRTAAR